MSNMDDEPHGYDGMGAPISVPTVPLRQHAVRLPILDLKLTPPAEAKRIGQRIMADIRGMTYAGPMTFVYDPAPEPTPARKPQEGDPFYLPDADGIYYLAGRFGPAIPCDDADESFLIVPVPQTWQSEGGDQA